MLRHIKSLIAKAQKGEYALGAFNTSNLEVTLGIIRGALAAKSPVIVQVSEATIEYAGVDIIAELVKITADTEGKKLDIALHLDHGHSLATVKACIKAGFSSVHMDASSLPFAENVARTKAAAVYAHQHGVYCQGELGAMLGKEGLTKLKLPSNASEYMTDPAKAREFVEKTGIDTLAISVGTLHGYFEGKENIDFPRLKAIHDAVPRMPLVLHGASGLPLGQLSRAVKGGVRIVNIDTAMRIAFTATLRQTIKTLPKNFHDPRKVLAPSIVAVSEAVIKEIQACGSGK